MARTLAFVPPKPPGFAADVRGARAVPEPAIHVVTSLQDDGPGSLRSAINGDNRLILFRVGGTILLRKPLRLDTRNVTILGHSAPGGGIAISSNHQGPGLDTLLEISGANIICRHLRFRGTSVDLHGNNTDRDCVSIRSTASAKPNGIWLDHCSFAFATDGNLDVSGYRGPVRDVTVSNCLLAFPVHGHNETPLHRFNSLIDGDVGAMTCYRNVYAFSGGRNPRCSSWSTAGTIEFVNNYVVDNARHCDRDKVVATNPPPAMNIVANLFRLNNAYFGAPERHAVDIPGRDPYSIPAFVRGNLSWYRHRQSMSDVIIMGRSQAMHATKRPFTTSTLDYDSAVAAIGESDRTTRLDEDLLRTVGCRAGGLDSIDRLALARIETRSGGGVISHPSDLGRFPTLAPGTPWSMPANLAKVEPSSGFLYAELFAEAQLASPTATPQVQ